jgi:hypothetical protein
MSDRAAAILLALEGLREDLLGLSDDIWLDVDHNDSEKVREACEFKSLFNKELAQFTETSTSLAALIQSYTGAAETEEEHQEDTSTTTDAQSDADRDSFSLDRSFTYTRPYGYVIEGRRFTGVSNWIRLYLSACMRLQQSDASKFQEIVTSKSMITTHGNKMLALWDFISKYSIIKTTCYRLQH